MKNSTAIKIILCQAGILIRHKFLAPIQRIKIKKNIRFSANCCIYWAKFSKWYHFKATIIFIKKLHNTNHSKIEIFQQTLDSKD